MKIVILGPQGAGKSLQADLISKHFGIPHIDVGQLLRDHIARKTEIGKKIEGQMKRGELMPSAIVDKIVKERLSQPDCAKGFVFDGYPRELAEAEFLDELVKLDAVLVLEVPDDLAINRISARRVCLGCTAPLYGLPKDIGKACGECGGKLVQREDDKPGPVKKRLQLYHEVTEPLIEYYKPRDIVHRVDATGNIQTVFKLILKALQ
jgi:adenylate kinase